MKNHAIAIIATVLAVTSGGCDSESADSPWSEGDPVSRISSFYVDGELADFEDQDEELKEELTAALIDADAGFSEDTSITHRRFYSCEVDCGGGTSMTCTGNAGCATTANMCASCDDDGGELTCWTFTC